LLTTASFELALDLLAAFEDAGHTIEHVPDLSHALAEPRLDIDALVVDLEGSEEEEERLLRRWTIEQSVPMVLVSPRDHRRLARGLGATFFQRPVGSGRDAAKHSDSPPRLRRAAGGDTLPDALWALALVDVVDAALAARAARLDAAELARRRLDSADEPPISAPASWNTPEGPAVFRDVLVIDDDYSVRQALSDALEDQGYSVAVAPDGRTALNLVRRVTPRLILLDLMMPGMDGWQFRDELRRDPLLAAIPVAVVSALVPFDQQSALAVEAVLKKPIDLAHLLHTVESLIG